MKPEDILFENMSDTMRRSIAAINMLVTEGSATSTTVNVGSPVSFSYSDMVKLVESLNAIPEPIGLWMKQQGYDPAEGCIMVVPVKLAAEVFGLGNPLPSYVHISSSAKGVYLYRNPLRKEALDAKYFTFRHPGPD